MVNNQLSDEILARRVIFTSNIFSATVVAIPTFWYAHSTATVTRSARASPKRGSDASAAAAARPSAHGIVHAA